MEELLHETFLPVYTILSPFSISHFLSAYYTHISHFLQTVILYTNSQKQRITPEACDIHRQTPGRKKKVSFSLLRKSP
jgi:hypothetical protein